MTPSAQDRPSFAPRNWPSWLAVGLIWLMGQMPQRAGLALSRPLGWLAMRLATARRRVAQRNIERCFPDWTDAQRERLLKDHFRSVARMLFETAWTWAAPEKRLDRWGYCVGLEHALEARKEGRGVLLLSGHMTGPEIGGWYPARAVGKPWVVYRVLKNPVLEWYSNRCRRRFIGGAMGNKRVFQNMVQHLKQGKVLWYAPDQDFGPKRSEFAPFFGIPTATLIATVRLVEQSGCLVVPLFTAFDEEQRKYVATFHPPLEDFPSGDLVADLARINALIEAHARRWPAQYWWIHRRFKTRPPGEPPFYD